MHLFIIFDFAFFFFNLKFYVKCIQNKTKQVETVLYSIV